MTTLAIGFSALQERSRVLAREPGNGTLRQGLVLPALRESIVAGDFGPGARLSEAELARCLGVSRTPIREALGALERERLVTMVPRLGAFVRTISEADVDEIYVVREALDVLATRLVVERVTPVGLARIEESVAIMRAAVANDDHRAYVEELDKFYALLMHLSGNATLELLHTSLLGPVRRLRRISMSYEGRMRRSFEQLEAIAGAIAERDSRAEGLMREQISRARETVKEVARHMRA